MRNTTFLTLGQAAKYSTASKATIQRAIKNSKLSANKEGSEWRIDPAELERWESTRVSRETPMTRSATPLETHLETPDTALKDLEILHLKEKLEMLETAHREKVAMLGGANDDLRAERDDWKGQAKQLLLTHQHEEKKTRKGFLGLFK